MDFRGQGLVNAIHLSWTIKWRRLRNNRASFEPRSHEDWDDAAVGGVREEEVSPGGPIQIAPNAMLRLIWRAGDAEPAEEMISAAFTSYTLNNLRKFSLSLN